MRGKLRDKRIDTRRGNIKRDLLERRRPATRRDTRAVALLNRQIEEEYLLDDEEEMVAIVAKKVGSK